MTQHDQSIGGPGAIDGIAGSRPGTEGATSGAGVDKGGRQKPQPHEGPGRVGQRPGGMGGNSSDNQETAEPGVMQTEPRENHQERKPGP